MSDFRVKLLGLAAVATVFAGMSYGQVSCLTGGAGTPLEPTSLNTTSPILDRAESEADLVSDVILLCPDSTLTSNGTLTVFSSLPVSSKVAAAATLSGTAGNSEAILTICPAQALGTGCINPTTLVAVGGSTFYQGTVSGSIVTFSGVTFPAAFTAQISNIRVNLSGSAIGSTPTPITESIFAGTNGLATVVYNNVTVGYGLKSLVTPSILANAFGPIVTNYTVCQGSTTAATSFTVVLAETFGGFFKTQTGVNSVPPPVSAIQNGEQGSYQIAGNTVIGTAASGTQFTLTFANLPSVATVYLPPTVNFTAQTAAGPPPVVSTVGTLSLPATSVPVAAPSPFAGLVAYTPSSGTVTATYTVTASSAAYVETFNVPVVVGFAANAASAQGPVTVLAAYAPAAALTGQATSIPDFAPTSNTPLNGSTISICQTSLLFPFVTNQLGFDTGLVLSNTSTDPLGIAGKSFATPQAGACTLNFYGAGAPTSGSAAAPGGAAATGTTNAFLLSSVAPGFQGYMIAVCANLWEHGFAYIAYDLTQTNGATMGYLAEVISDRPAVIAGGVESLGQ
jgi:hypothetical protein